MARELPENSRCTAIVERTGERCNTARVTGTPLCWLHGRSPEERSDVAKRAAAESARVRSAPPAARRMRRRTAAERAARPDLPSRVETEEADAQDTFWPEWRRVEGRPIGFRSRVGDDGFKVLGHFEAPAEPGGEPRFADCSTCDKVCSQMAAPAPSTDRTPPADTADGAATQSTTKGEAA